MNQSDQHQKGGVVSFTIVGALLLMLLVGGIYLSKQQGRTASREGNTAANVSVPEKATETDKKPDPTPVRQPATDNKPKENTTTPRTDSNSQAPATPPAQTNSTTPPTVATTGPSHIASTGPGEVMMIAIALGAVAGGLSWYRQSTQRMHQAALRSSL